MAIALALLLVLVPAATNAAQSPKLSGELSAVVSTQGGAVRLPGATVTVTSGDVVITTLTSDDTGRFTVPLSQGRYTVTTALAGFMSTSVVVVIVADAKVTLAIELPIQTISQSVEVVAQSPVSTSEGTIAATETIDGKELDQFAPSGLQASLRLLASIIEVPGGVSIKGGRPNQASVQLGSSSLVDPSTGLTQFMLPDDAIDSVAVLPNPYAVEYGRFSSGLIVIRTRRAGDEWKVRLNSPDPTFRSTRTSPFDLVGIGWWGPRLEVGGPIVKDRLFLEQAAQYRYSASDVPSLPLNELRTSKSFSSFTRLDGVMSARHTFVATGAFVPGVADQATLGTFTPPAATVNLQSQANEMAFSERAVWTDTLLSETTIQAHDYQSNVLPQGTAPMELRPETTLGNFFNQQHRETATYQLVSSVSSSREALGGLHLYKAGIDLMHSTYDGWSVSRPIAIEASGGTLVRRLDFSGVPSFQHVISTDIALFAQDRFQLGPRYYSEFGIRLDRDGITERFNVTPRVGGAWVLNESGSSVIRGGFGLFFERTPSAAGAFGQFESYPDTRYAADGVTPIGEQLVVDESHPFLRTPRSRTWDVGYEQRLSKNWSMHLAAIDRQGSHELIVNSLPQTAAVEALTLSSNGRSSYRAAEIGVRAAYGQRGDLNVSYTRASARADLNSLTTYFDSIRAPVIGENQYAPANSDIPNRLFARGRLMPTDRWLLLGIFDWRSGLPYSLVNADLDFIGVRNSLRFPAYQRLEVGLERRFKILKLQPWIGVRLWNALSSFLPTDVQNNVSSPAFGSFYNSEYRQFRIQFRFER